MIRSATENDLDQIMAIIKATIAEMKTYNNTQWDDHYPQRSDFKNDIDAGSLYVHESGDEIAGFVCANFIEPCEYDDISWYSNDKCYVLHRMSVNPMYRNQGVGSKLIEFVEHLAKEQGVNYIKTDTYSINTKMNSLFIKLGYIHRGNMCFLGREKAFYCYDKVI